jgi:hypothetical protein
LALIEGGPAGNHKVRVWWHIKDATVALKDLKMLDLLQGAKKKS